MERRPTSIRTTLAVSVLALTLIAPWVLGQDPDPDPITELRSQAEQGDAEAQYDLGVRYSLGDGVPEDHTEAARWFRLAAEQEATSRGWVLTEEEWRAVVALSMEIEQPARGDFLQMSLAAALGHASSQGGLGLMYHSGIGGVPQDYQEAARWFRLASEQGDVLGQSYLGLMYHNGQGVLRDDQEAVKWSRLAAEQGNALAQFNLGSSYFNGWGIPQDYQEAARWSRLAAEQGNARAQSALGLMYDIGLGVLKDAVIAHMWLNIAGANGAEGSGELRDNLERDMTRAEISRAMELARTCMASNYQDCEP